MVDQPVAPPGWYPDLEKPGNENWWDGTAWLDRSRPVAVIDPPAEEPISKPRVSGFGLFVIIAVGVIVMVVGAKIADSLWDNRSTVSAKPATSSTKAAPPVDTGPRIPAGYEDTGQGVAFKWVTPAVPDCSYFDYCVVAEFYAYSACPSALYVEAAILNSDKTIVDKTNELSTSLRVGDKVQVTLGWFRSAGGTLVRLTEVSCY